MSFLFNFCVGENAQKRPTVNIEKQPQKTQQEQQKQSLLNNKTVENKNKNVLLQSDKNEEIKQLKKKVESLNMELDSMKHKYNALNMEKDKWLVSISGNDDKLQKLLSELKKYKLNSEETDKKLLLLQTEYNEINDLYKRNCEELNETKDEVQVLEQQLNQYEKWLEKSRGNKKQLQETIDSLKKQNDKLLDKLNDDNKNNNNNNDNNNNKKDYSSSSIQGSILKNSELRSLSLSLLKGSNNGLIRFMTKMLASDVTADKIWNKQDINNSGKISTKKIPKLLSLPVIFYKVTQHQKKNKNGDKPNIDNALIIKSIEHLSIWIIIKYGKKTEDGSYRMQLTKKDFKTKLISWMNEYIECDGN